MLRRIVDFDVSPPVRSESRNAVAFVTSAIVHAVIILFLLFGLPRASGVPATQDAAPMAQPLAVAPPREQPPATPFRPQPPPPTAKPTPPPPPPPPQQQVELGPDSKKPDAPAREAAANKTSNPDPVTPAPSNTTPTPPAPPPSPAAAKQAEPEAPAPQRLQVPRPGDNGALGRLPSPQTSPWGPPKLDSASGAPAAVAAPPVSSMGRVGLASQDPRKWETSFDNETSGKCVEIPDLGKNSDGTPVLASVIGRVLDTDGRTPLGGAHLQIMGTQFGTFSDHNGEYRLDFDPRMLAKCRVQYVQVVAPGYQNQLLRLSIGPRVRSDDVVLRHGR